MQPLETKAKFGSDGTALPGSFAVLTGEVADLEKVDPSSVDMAYFRTSDAETAALDQYLNGVNGTASLYVVGFHDCIEVCNNALAKANIGRGLDWFDVPRAVIWDYSFLAYSTYSGASGEKKVNNRKRKKDDVHSTIKYCGDGGSGCEK